MSDTSYIPSNHTLLDFTVLTMLADHYEQRIFLLHNILINFILLWSKYFRYL